MYDKLKNWSNIFVNTTNQQQDNTQMSESKSSMQFIKIGNSVVAKSEIQCITFAYIGGDFMAIVTLINGKDEYKFGKPNKDISNEEFRHSVYVQLGLE